MNGLASFSWEIDLAYEKLKFWIKKNFMMIMDLDRKLNIK
jgi:hypothetical protein